MFLKKKIAEKCVVTGFFDKDDNGIIPLPKTIPLHLLYDMNNNEQLLEHVFTLNKCFFAPQKMYSLNVVENTLSKYELFIRLKEMMTMIFPTFLEGNNMLTSLPQIFCENTIIIHDYVLCDNNTMLYLKSIKDFLMKLYKRNKITISTICGTHFKKQFDVRFNVTIFSQLLDSNIQLIQDKVPIYVIICIVNKILHCLFGFKFIEQSKTINVQHIPTMFQCLRDDILMKDYLETLLAQSAIQNTHPVNMRRLRVRSFTIPIIEVCKLIEILIIQKKNYIKNADPDKNDSLYQYDDQILLLEDALDIQDTYIHEYDKEYNDLELYEPVKKRIKKMKNANEKIINMKKRLDKCFFTP